MISEVYTCTTWNLLRRYHFALHSDNLTFTTSVQFDFRVLHPYNLNLCQRYNFVHYSCTTWLLLYSYNLISGFYTCTTWNLYLYGKMTYLTLHLHTLIFITFTKAWFPWLFHSCCVCMFCYIYIFCTYIYV